MVFWLYVLLLSLHLAAMNVAGGAPLVSCWLEWRERKGESVIRAAADYLAVAALASLLVGALLGLAIIGLRWTPAFVEVWSGPMARKLKWGVAELLFSLLLAGGYILWRRAVPEPGSAARRMRLLLPLLSGTNLLYHFPSLFLVASQLSAAGATTGPSLTAAEFRRQMVSGTTPAMVTHVVFASLAAGGIVLLGLALRWLRQGRAREEIVALSRGAAQLALVPTLAQIVVGLWILTRMDSSSQSQLLGGSLVAAGCFVVGLGCALWLMQLLAALAFGDPERGLLIKSMTAFLATVYLMTATWHLARPLPLAPASHAPAPSTAGFSVQDGPKRARSPLF